MSGIRDIAALAWAVARHPVRAVRGVGVLASGLWRDWFPGRTCRTCRWYKDYGRGHGTCNRAIGFGYGARTREHCTYWEQ